MEILRLSWSKLFSGCALLLCVNASSQQWTSDLNTALQEARSSHKKVLLYFSVPEHCHACNLLEENVFTTDIFKDYVRDRFVLVRPEFSETDSFEQKQDKLMIVEKYNRDGFFPLVVILDSTARVLGKTGVYQNESAEEYLKILGRIGQ